MRGLPSRFRPGRLVLVLACALVGACDDLRNDTPLVGPGNAGPFASYPPDPAIDPADTYYLAEVYQEGSTTVETQAPVTDPVTGAVSYQFTALHEPETQRVEGGYDKYGRIIQVLDQTDAIPTRCSCPSTPRAAPAAWTRRSPATTRTATPCRTSWSRCT